MLRLILGAAGSGKTSVITKEISTKVAAGETNICLIVPEQYSHEAERELCSVCGDGLSLSAEVLSFSRLAVRVAQEMGTGGRTYLDGGGRLLCMSLALNQISSRLRLYSAASRDPRLQLELLRTVEELKTACISPEALLEAAQEAEGELSAKLSDLSLCLETYEAILAQGHADPSDRLVRLAETVGESSIGKNGQFYIDGFLDFTGAELEVIKALLKQGAPLTVCLTCDGLYADGEQFMPSRITAYSLLRFAKELGQEAEALTVDTDDSRATPLRFYNDHLFLHTLERVENSSGEITVFRTDDLRCECELAAACCIRLVRETGCRWADIAIAARGFSDYSAALEESFRLYDVPLFSAVRGSILQKPIPALLEAAFDVISGGWDIEDVLCYMKTGLTGVPRWDCDILAGYVTLWNIGGSSWTKESPWKQNPLGFAKKETEDSKSLLDKINSLRRKIAAPLITLEEKGRQAKTALEQARALSEFLAEINLPETLSAHVSELEAAGRLQLADEFSQLWGVLCRALEQFTALLGQLPMSQNEFFGLFLKMLAQYDVSSIPFSPDSVSAGEIDRMRRRNIKHLLVLGASDDRFPAASESTGLLSEEDRDFLGVKLLLPVGAADSLSRELSLIYNCVCLPSHSLTLSYHSSGDDGAKLRPSFLINRAVALMDVETKTPKLSALRLSARKPAFLLAAGASGSSETEAALAFAYFESTSEGRERLHRLKRMAKTDRGHLSEGSVESLYGKTISISPSRADAFVSCRFYYFLRYGLKLNEREKAGFNPPELGTYMHYVLEKCAGEISSTVGFHNATEDLAGALADKYTDIYITERLGGFEEKSPRFVFLFNRLRPSVRRVVTDMVRELSLSDFAPLDFELFFGRGGKLPPITLGDGENKLQISGIADRVDGYFRDGKLYLRVMDYKTGKKSFSLSDVWYGMGMQMLLYLFALEHKGDELYGEKIVPAGVLYIPARDEIISSPGDLTNDELERAKAKTRRRSGLLLRDETVLDAMEKGEAPEYIPVKYKNGVPTDGESLTDESGFKALGEHVEGRLLELQRNLSEGRIDAHPCYKTETDNACLYCPYGQVCRFDEGRDERRYLTKVKAEDFWNRLAGGTDE